MTLAATPTAAPAAATTAAAAAPAPRRVGLDVARGLMLVVSVAVNAWVTAPAWFEHAPWAGVHPVDLVFPTFVTLSGCGLAFAYGRRVAAGPTIRRAVVLVAVGCVVTALTDRVVTGRVDLATFHVFGVLQLYAVVVLVVALAHLLVRNAAGWAAITLTLAAAHTAALAHYAAGCPGGQLTPACNPSRAVDFALVGAAHVYHQGRFGHDPEGIVGMVGALVTASAGVTVGHILAGRVLPRRRIAALDRALPRLLLGLGAAALFALAGHVLADLAPAVPAMKRQWTAAFALPVAAATTAALVVLDTLLDGSPAAPRRRPRGLDAALYPFVALGRNSLLVYFGSHELMLLLTSAQVAPRVSRAQALADTLGAALHLPPALALIIAAEALWVAVACLLHSRRIYLRP